MHDLWEDLKRDAADTDDRNITLSTIMLGTTALFMCVVNIVTHTTIMIFITALLAAWSFLNYYIYKKTRSFKFVSIGILSVVTLMMLYFVVSGGKDGFSIVWLLMVPPLSTFFFKLLYGGMFSIILGALTTLYLWTPLHYMGYVYSATYQLRFPIVYFIELLVCLYINYTIMVYRQKQVTLLEMAQQASSTKSDFLANMSHEIRTPLNAVVGMCELVLRESDISDTVRDYCFNIQNSGRSLLAIINDILDFSKIESGRMELIKESFNITSTVNDVINMAVTRKGEKPIELIVKCDPDIPAGLIGDELRIRQVMINLVTNAIKFTHNGCVVIKISKTVHDYGINLSVSVSDTGIGISPENIERLFSSFQQVNTKKNRSVEGTGLGLAISKKFIESMGGFINVSSVYGSGSEFKFVIPLEVSDPTPCIVLKNKNRIHAACFFDLSKFGIPRVAKEYTTLISDLAEGFNAGMEIIDDVDILREKVEKNEFTHIYAGREEYVSNCEYIKSVADKVEVVIIQDRINGIEIPSQMKCIYKPFYSLAIAAVLNNESIIENMSDRRNSMIRFIAPKARVLVVDDNAVNLKVAVGLMRPYNMQVLTVDSGRAAISMLRSKDIDLVFMDHMMPEMDGVETTAAIRSMEGEYYQKLPIIAMTANAVNGVRDMYIEAGLNDFIAKPIELPVLARVLKTWLPRELIKVPSRNDSYPRGRRKTDNKPKDSKSADSALFNPDTGIFYTGGDEEAYVEILEMYVRKADEKHDEIKKHFEEKSWKNYVIEVHALKSSSLSIGSKRLSDLAKELELAGKAGNYSLIEEKNSLLLEMYKQVAEIGRKYLKLEEEPAAEEKPAEEAVSLPEIAIDKIREYADRIKEACESFDGDAVAEICTEAAGFAFNGQALSRFFDEIKADANDFEYDSAAEKAAAVVEKLS